MLQVAIDSATPVEDYSQRGNFPVDEPEPFLGYGGPMRAYGSAYGRIYGSLDFNDVSRVTYSVLKLNCVTYRRTHELKYPVSQNEQMSWLEQHFSLL